MQYIDMLREHRFASFEMETMRIAVLELADMIIRLQKDMDRLKVGL